MEMEFRIEEFSKLYNPAYKQRHVKHLSTPGTWLDDDDIHNLFCLMAWKKEYSPRDVRIVYSLLLEGMMKGREQTRATKTYIKNLFTKDLPEVLLVPIYYSNHWSLLYYRSSTGAWHHMDSLAPYHQHYVKEVMKRLDEEGYLLSLNKEVLHFKRMPRQPQGWECGIYLLLYMLIVSESLNDQQIQEKIAFTSDYHRKELTRSLLALLK